MPSQEKQSVSFLYLSPAFTVLCACDLSTTHIETTYLLDDISSTKVSNIPLRSYSLYALLLP